MLWNECFPCNSGQSRQFEGRKINFWDHGNFVFQVLVLFAVLNLISKKVEDRTLILFGYLCEVVTLAYLMWYLPSAPRRKCNIWSLFYVLENVYMRCSQTFVLVGHIWCIYACLYISASLTDRCYLFEGLNPNEQRPQYVLYLWR